MGAMNFSTRASTSEYHKQTSSLKNFFWASKGRKVFFFMQENITNGRTSQKLFIVFLRYWI